MATISLFLFIGLAVLSGLLIGNINVYRLIRGSDAFKKFNDYSTDEDITFEIFCEPNYLDEDRLEIKFGKSDSCIVATTIMEIIHTKSLRENQDHFIIVLIVCIFSS